MARLSRVVVPGVPHHVTQRGNRRLPTFFGDDDYRAYRELLAEGCKAAEVDILAYCLMPNHVHLVLTPASDDGLRAALADARCRQSNCPSAIAPNFRSSRRMPGPIRQSTDLSDDHHWRW